MSKEIVVSHYEKPLQWIGGPDKNILISVYNKSDKKISIKQPNVRMTNVENVGREPHTFLLHIYNNWEYLRDYTYFVQDNPFEHGVILEDFEDKPPVGFKWLGTKTASSDETGKPFDNDVEVEEIAKELGLKITYPVLFKAGGQFVVDNTSIQKKGREFYKKALEMFDKYPKAPWAFERLWEAIFT